MARAVTLAPGATATLRLRLRPRANGDPFADFDAAMAQRLDETDAFYDALQAGMAEDARLVQRQAFAGMLWCKQFYGYDIRRWLAGDPLQPAPPSSRSQGRNGDWRHFASGDVDTQPSPATSCRCPIPGNIRGSPPGIWRFTA